MHVTTVTTISVSVLMCFVVSYPTAANEVDIQTEEPNSISNDEHSMQGLNHAVIKHMWEKRCSRQYNVGCLKIDLVRLMNRLDGSTNFQILPGVSLVKSSPSLSIIPTEVIASKPDAFLDNYLLNKFTNYLSSLTINVKVLDPAIVSTAKSFGDSFGFGADSNTTATARRRNRFSNTMVTAGLMSGGTILILGMSALAAMAGKALMTSLLSLMLSAMGALKSNGDGGHKSTTYEIVTRPVVTHAHSHTSEVQHITGHGGHGSHDSGYGYARSMASTPVQPVVNEDTYNQYTPNYKNEEGSRIPYKVHEPQNSTTYSLTPTQPSFSSENSPTYSPQRLNY